MLQCANETRIIIRISLRLTCRAAGSSFIKSALATAVALFEVTAAKAAIASVLKDSNFLELSSSAMQIAAVGAGVGTGVG